MTGDDLSPADSAPPKVRHRPSWIVFVVLGAIVCLGMGYWQLARFQEASGTVQNLGYTFMWPVLAAFLVYAYYKYVQLEANEAADDIAADEFPTGDSAARGPSVDEDYDEDDDEVAAPRTRRHVAGGARRRSATPTEIPADILPVRRTPADAPVQDEGLHAYNIYLAELARQDARTAQDAHSTRPAAGDRSQEEPDT